MNKEEAAQIIWEYMLLHHELKRSDALFVLGSRDERVAAYAAKLFLDKYADWLIISGGVAHSDDLLRAPWGDKTEAEHFGDIAIKAGVPKDKIILENKASNTGENIQFTYELLQKRCLSASSFILVQKSYMERRTFATFKKQWPDKATGFTVTSPKFTYDNYFDDQNPKEEIPSGVWKAFEVLVQAGYTGHLIKAH